MGTVTRQGPRSGGLDPVPASEVIAAISRAGRRNPLLGIGIGIGAGIGTAGGDAGNAGAAGSADLGVPGPVDGASAARLIDAVGAWLGTDQRRVAASLVVLGYAARLVGPAVAVLLRESIVLDVQPAQVEYSFVPDRGFRLTMRHPGGWRGEPATMYQQWCRIVIDEHLAPLVDRVQAVVPVATGLLWGNVASGLAGALCALAREGSVAVGRCHDVGLILLDHGPLRGAGRLERRAGGLAYTRRSCCLYYRLPGGGMCGDCALIRPTAL